MTTSAHDTAAMDSSIRALAIAQLSRQPTLPQPGGGRTLVRWQSLAAIAGQDVCLVKVLEAHYDAAAILIELGATAPLANEIWAVWAAEPPGLALDFIPIANESGVMNGTKAWCSGADLVTHALVTVCRGDERGLVRIALASEGISKPATQWAAVGMSRVVSGSLDFDAVTAHQVGDSGEYLSRPGFWHGGAGIAACWYGGARAIAETLRSHPKVAKDAHAAAHLGAIDMQLCAAAALLRELADAIDMDPRSAHVHATLRVRSFVERVATETVDRVARALGAGPLCMDHQHALRCADLMTFIRQSHAERDWEMLGRYAAEGASTWRL